MEGQSLDVSKESEIGEVGKSVAMIWKVGKFEKSDIIQTSNLVLGNRASGVKLFQGINPVIELPAARNLFPDRLNATWDGENYTLTLSKLTLEDTKAFTFLVIQTEQDGSTIRSSLFKTITIVEVRGMYYFPRHYIQ